MKKPQALKRESMQTIGGTSRTRPCPNLEVQFKWAKELCDQKSESRIAPLQTGRITVNLKSKQTVVFSTLLLIVIVCAPMAFAASDDACMLLTQAQVSTATGVSVGAGTHVTSTFLKTCTWSPTPAGNGVKSVTLNLQTSSFYDGGKAKMQQGLAMAGSEAGMSMIPASGLGDDAYFLKAPNMMSLFVKKGADSFKIAIYGKPPSKDIQSAEKELAQEVLAKM